jgi:Domain of unknown function (DUF6378)
MASTTDAPETVLEEAQRIIYGDREKTYGHPAKNFENTAGFWQAWFVAKYGSTPPIDVEDVAMMMVLLKLARQAHGHKRDNLVDLCGYAACIQKVLDYGGQTRNDVLPEGAPTFESECLPDETLESIRSGASGSLVFREPVRFVDRVEVPAPPKTPIYADFARPHHDAAKMDGLPFCGR